MSSTSFRGKSVLWVMTDTVSTSLLSIGTMLVLARFAGPSDFGAASLIMGMTMLLNLYVEGLFHDALIQNRAIDARAYDQALTLVLLIAGGIIAATLVVAVALSGGPYARYAWLSVGSNSLLAFSGPVGIANAHLRRDMRFREVARASVIGRVVGCCAAIAFATTGYGLIGLVAQNTVASMTQTAVLYSGGAWSPRLRFSLSSLREVLRFALPYAFMHTLVAARIQGFAFMAASLMGLSAAGYINVAFRLATTPQIAMLTTLTNLCFPLLAQHQASRPDFERAFTLNTKLITTISFPLFVGLALVAADLVPLLLGAQWTPSIVLVQIVAIGAALGFGRTAGSLALRALGYVRFSFWNAIFQLIFTLGGLAILRPSDPIVAVALWMAPIVIQIPITFYVVRREARISLRDQLRGLAPSLAATAAMTAAVMALRAQTAALGVGQRLTLSVAIGAIAFIATILASDSDARSMIRHRRSLHA